MFLLFFSLVAVCVFVIGNSSHDDGRIRLMRSDFLKRAKSRKNSFLDHQIYLQSIQSLVTSHKT